MNYPVSIGIIGGGQLGKMMTVAAKKLGFSVVILDPTPDAPAGQVADRQIVANYNDETAVKQLAKLADVITVEVEVTDEEGLQTLLENVVKNGTPVQPSPQTFRIIQDKLKQKEFLRVNAIPTAAFMGVETRTDITYAIERFSYPVILKARTGAYDGKGNAEIHSEKDIEKAIAKLKNRKVYVEQYVPFVKELAVMVARSTKEETAVYPVVETRHVNNVCDIVLVPAPISEKARIHAEHLARHVVEKLTGTGVFGIEIFLKKDDTVYINEIAPRVHNSGHFTIEAAVTSQFEQHIRAITGLPLGDTTLIPKAAVMKNILGTKTGTGFPKSIEKILAIPGVSLHLYGKKETRIGRKMGHITVVGESIETCLRKANEARRMLII